MDGATRRIRILKELSQAEKTISATKLANKFAVSRQIIVGDIALLRASGEEIIATSRGYRLQVPKTDGLEVKIAVCHGPNQVKEELTTILENGGEIVDVIVEHELYGEITGRLCIKTADDLEDFMEKYQQSNSSLLSNLTGGIHLHTIRCQDQQALDAIQQALKEKGILLAE